MKLAHISLLVLLLLPQICLAGTNCIYTSKEGVIVSTSSIEKVPKELKDSAKCFSSRKKSTSVKENKINTKEVIFTPKNRSNLKTQTPPSQTKKRKTRSPRANNVALNKSKRQKVFKSALGQVNLRWEASIEKYIGRPPATDVNLAMKAAARVIGQKAFSSSLKKMHYDWRIVIMGKVPNNTDIGTNGSGKCHPGWIRRGSDIYISLERISTSCGRTKRSEAATVTAFRETLIHEIGHAIEYKLLGRKYRQSKRWHKEGFATWFESLGADYLTGKGQNRSVMKKRVKKYWSDTWRPESFSGSHQDYTRGYAMIATMAEKQSVYQLIKVYKSAVRNNISVIKAAEKELNWPIKVFYKKVKYHFGVS